MCNNYRKTPVLESLFNKVAYSLGFITKRPQQKCFPVIFACSENTFRQWFFETLLNRNFYFKGCARYIFAGLFCMPKVSTCEKRKNVFLFSSKALFVLELMKFSLFGYSNVMTSSNAKAWNTKHILLNNLGNKHSLVIIFH